MLRTLKENQPDPSSFSNLHLSSNIPQLLAHYQNEENSFVRICILSKIKQIIIAQLWDHSTQEIPSHNDEDEITSVSVFHHIQRQILHEDPKNPNTIFSAFFLRFMRRDNANRSLPRGELHLFFHVVSLVIKYFYSEDHFKFLFNEITQLVQNHKQRIQTALDFFIQVISTIQFNYQQSFSQQKLNNFGAKINHCRFQRHFTTSHLNSMLFIANFFMEKAILKDNQAIEDGVFSESFKIRASEEQICSILQLLHRVLCFDFIGEKYSQSEENYETANIIIPTKNTKHTNLSQFEKWLKNSEWIRIYQFIYQSCRAIKIKLIIIDIFGDMARIHMKYFKNKNCFKVHIENIVYALADILEQTVVHHSKEDVLRISIAVGRNLLKMTSPSIVPMFFDINSNLYAGLLQNVKNFLIEHIISEEIFNINIIYYFFKFIYNLHIRCKFEKTASPFEMIERVTREICRNYENYLRSLLKKLFKNFSCLKVGEHFQIRQDYLHMKDCFQNYQSQEIMIYLSPFKFMKPRYTSVNTIQQLFVMACAKFVRSLYIIDTYPQNLKEIEFALQMIEKSIFQTIEWFTYTTYYKNIGRNSSEDGSKRKSSMASKYEETIELTMESISQQYEEQIQNQFQYCHMLRIISYFMIECIDKLPDRIYKHLNKNNQIFQLINLSLLISFQADLQENQNQQKLNITVRTIIEERIDLCRQILEKLFLRQWQYQLFVIKLQNNEKIFTYRFKSFENQLQFLDFAEVKDQYILIDTIKRLKSPFRSRNEAVDNSLKQMQLLLAYNIARQEQNHMEIFVTIDSLDDCLCFIILLLKNQALLSLLHHSQPIIRSFFLKIVNFVREYESRENSTAQAGKYMQVLSYLIKLKYDQIQEEMANRLFLFLKEVVSVIQLPESVIKSPQQLMHYLQNQPAIKM